MHKTRRTGFDPAKLAAVKIPVLVLIGDKDDPASAKRLAEAIPGASFVEVPGDHLGAVATPQFTRAIVEWLTADSGCLRWVVLENMSARCSCSKRSTSMR